MLIAYYARTTDERALMEALRMKTPYQLRDVRAAMRCVAINISITVMFEASDVSFTIAISELDSGGNAVRSACGSTMRRMICI